MAKRRSEVAETTEASDVLPLYYQLAIRLRGELLLGTYAAGEAFHSNRNLVSLHGMSLLTVRRALDELVREGLLEQQHGKGTFVSRRIEALRLKARAKDTRQPAILFSGWALEALTSWDAMYFRDLYSGLKREAERQDLRLLTDSDLPPGEGLAERAAKLGLRGAAVMVGTGVEKRAAALKDAGVPVVTINFALKEIQSVAPDDRAGAVLATRHLLELGHRRFVHLNSGETTPHWTDVARGYADALNEAGLALDENPIIHAPERGGSIAAGYGTALQALRRGTRATGFVCGNDLMAIGAMKALKEYGVAVPDEASVIGFDNIEAADICSPGLTTVAVDREALGRAAVQWLVGQLKPESLRWTLSPSIKRRESTAPAPVAAAVEQ